MTPLSTKTNPGLQMISLGLRALIDHLGTLRSQVTGFFPKPIQAERLIQNAQDYLAEAELVLELAPVEGFNLQALDKLQEAIGEAADDLNRIHGLNHEVGEAKALLGPPYPFFLVESIVSTYSSMGDLLTAVRNELRAHDGPTEAEKEAHGRPQIHMIGMDGSQPPPEILRAIMNQLRHRLEGGGE